jgi:hypothetical protein
VPPLLLPSERPQEEEFSETPVGEGEEDVPAPLKGADPSTPVMVGGVPPPQLIVLLEEQILTGLVLLFLA